MFTMKLSLCTLTLLFTVGANAASQSFKLDPEHTFAVFRVNHLGYSTMIGRFDTVSGELGLDQDNLEGSTVNVVIDTTSVNTNHQKRDDHLRSPDFFNSAEFPEMSFTSKEVKKTGEGTLQITGDFTLLGVTKPVTLEATFNDVKPHPLPQYNNVLVAGFSARTSVKRSDFGMSYALGGVGDEIDIWLEAEFHAK